MSAQPPLARRPFFRRRKTCPFTGPNAPKIDYKDSKLLMRYVSERGKIVPSRITAVSAIANDGVRMQPRIVERIVSPTGQTIEEFPPVEVARVASPRRRTDPRPDLTSS